MAKPLIFRFGDGEISFNLTKIDRSKLYGSREVEVLDEQGGTCELATLAGDGRTVVGRGGTGIGYLAPDGIWCEKSKLAAVDLEGNAIEPVPSSFSASIPLVETSSVDEYLEHNIRSIYSLQTDDDASALLEELRKGTVFKFPYSYRGGLESDAGFLLAGADDAVFLAVGNPTNVEFVGLQQTAAVVEEEEGAEDEAGAIDFDMI